jgi:tetratricopeptide (TPR) repeat protein
MDNFCERHKGRYRSVLPLQNLSDDPDEDYFAEGMTDELITELAKIRGLRVISRTSVKVYVVLGATKRHDESIAEARRGLDVDPLSIPVNNIVGEMLSAARLWKQAIDQYRKTIELDPSVALVHENLGTALEEIGQYDEALEEYLVARALSGEAACMVANLRKAYEKDR